MIAAILGISQTTVSQLSKKPYNRDYNLKLSTELKMEYVEDAT